MDDQNTCLNCQKTNDALTEANNNLVAANYTIDVLKETNENLLAENKRQAVSIEVQAKTITQLKGTVIAVTAKVEAPKIPEEAVEHDGREYKFTVAQFSLAGRGKVLAEDAAHDTELIADIIAIEGQSILKEQA